MPAIRRRAQRLRREIGDERFLAPSTAAAYVLIHQEPADQRVNRLAECEPRVDDRVDDPAADD